MDLLDNSKDALDMSRAFPVLWRREGDSWRPLGLKANWWSRVILISLFLRYPILHAPMFCHLPQGFQNCFCFCSTTFPSHVGTFFRLQWEFQWENDQNK